MLQVAKVGTGLLQHFSELLYFCMLGPEFLSAWHLLVSVQVLVGLQDLQEFGLGAALQVGVGYHS